MAITTSFTYHGTQLFLSVLRTRLCLLMLTLPSLLQTGGGSECTNAALVVLIETCVSQVKSAAVCLARKD